MDEQFQDLFKIRRNRKKVEIGNILIAEPFLQGKYFSRSVIFMVEHDEKGSIGFVLNKPMAYTTSAPEIEPLLFTILPINPAVANPRIIR